MLDNQQALSNIMRYVLLTNKLFNSNYKTQVFTHRPTLHVTKTFDQIYQRTIE